MVDERTISKLGKGNLCKVADINDDLLTGRSFSHLKMVLDQADPPMSGPDEMLMDGLKNPKLKDFWNALRPDAAKQGWGVWIWKLRPRRLALTAWKLFLDRIPCHDLLRSRGIPITSQCVLCKKYSETAQHLFFTCEVASKVWRGIWDSLSLKGNHPLSTDDIINSKANLGISIKVIQAIWNARNMATYEGIKIRFESIISNVRIMHSNC